MAKEKFGQLTNLFETSIYNLQLSPVEFCCLAERVEALRFVAGQGHGC